MQVAIEEQFLLVLGTRGHGSATSWASSAVPVLFPPSHLGLWLLVAVSCKVGGEDPGPCLILPCPAEWLWCSGP